MFKPQPKEQQSGKKESQEVTGKGGPFWGFGEDSKVLVSTPW